MFFGDILLKYYKHACNFMCRRARLKLKSAIICYIEMFMFKYLIVIIKFLILPKKEIDYKS